MRIKMIYSQWSWTRGMFILYLLLWFITGCSLGPAGAEVHCQNGIKSPCVPKSEPHPLLSSYNLYEGKLEDLKPIEKLVPYDLNTPLFSDYAQKLRMIYVPEGKTISYRDSGVLTFPVGSMLVKNFFYELNEENGWVERRILETRLLIHYKHGWVAETYVWNDAQTAAALSRSGSIKQVVWTDIEGRKRDIDYIIPTKNDCKTCHSYNNELMPLGLEARNLNKTYKYDGGHQNQLYRWQQVGILTGYLTTRDAPKSPVWDDPSTGTVEERARIYLDVNCGNCHSSSGVANYTSHYLNFLEEDPSRLGIWKRPVASGSGSGGLDYDIVPGKPDESILVYRMNAVKPNERMPEIGRTIVHDEAVELIKKWVGNMGCDSCP